MSLQQLNIRNSVLILMIVAAAATRMLNLGHIVEWANFTPVGAVALFGGAYFTDKWKAYLVPLLTLIISDLLINYTQYNHVGLYSGSWVVYLSFAVMVFIGSLIHHVNVLNVILASVGAVLVHWLLTDIQPWLVGTLYAKGPEGYLQSLMAALPFEVKMLYGNLLFCAILFGGFELAKNRYAALRNDRALAV
jgi:hypothetical protein